MEIPAHEVDPSLYTDWADSREYTIGDLGIGECAGEVVSTIEFALTDCEREVFEAQLLLERGDSQAAAAAAYKVMLHAASALLDWRYHNHTAEADNIVEQFRKYFYETEDFFDPFVGGAFAQHFFRTHERHGSAASTEAARQTIEEAQLFLEACHSCYTRLSTQQIKGAAQ
jgi:sulfite reductase (ferredoxin)